MMTNPTRETITCEWQERDAGEAGVGLCTLWGHGHLSRKDALRLPPLLHPSSGGGRVPWGMGCGGALGMPLPTQGCKAGECTEVQNEVTFGHRAHDILFPVLCRTTEQGCHVQSTLLFPRLPPGKVCNCSFRSPLSP